MRATATSAVELAQGIDRPSSVFAEIIIGPDALVRSIDEAAGSLFKGLVVPDAPLFPALVAVEKSGIIARGAAENIEDAIATGSERLFDMTDGRTFMMSPLMPMSGDRVIRFVDVSFVVRTVLSQERDVLTGLPNRVELVRRIEEHVASKAPEERGAVFLRRGCASSEMHLKLAETIVTIKSAALALDDSPDSFALCRGVAPQITRPIDSTTVLVNDPPFVPRRRHIRVDQEADNRRSTPSPSIAVVLNRQVSDGMASVPASWRKDLVFPRSS